MNFQMGSGSHHYADPDGLESVPAYDCAAACRDCGAMFTARSGGACPACPECGGVTALLCPVAQLDEQSGECGGGAKRPGSRRSNGVAMAGGELRATVGDWPNMRGGGASRFFPCFEWGEADFRYCAKASRSEREAGLEPVDGKRANGHPTVKPVALCRWLVRLVTPPGGIVLDPFAGSGSAGIAVGLEGFNYIGVELDSEGKGYVDIARARIRHHVGESTGAVATEADPMFRGFA